MDKCQFVQIQYSCTLSKWTRLTNEIQVVFVGFRWFALCGCVCEKRLSVSLCLSFHLHIFTHTSIHLPLSLYLCCLCGLFGTKCQAMMRRFHRDKESILPTRKPKKKKTKWKSTQRKNPTGIHKQSAVRSLWIVLTILVVGLLVGLYCMVRSTEFWIHGGTVKTPSSEMGWNRPTVHLVHTRFMQDQSQLHRLGQARLELFRRVCLPSMLAQSTQDYLWIIQTDPQLPKTLRRALLQLLRPHPHIFLIGSNRNFGFALNNDNNNNNYSTTTGESTSSGSWRDGQEAKSFFQSPIYSGNAQLLRQAYLARELVPVLETRLDADDGLHQRYLETVQQMALERLHLYNSNPRLDWMYLCPRKHLEWYPQSNTLKPVQHSHLCITAGLTVVFGTATQTVPELPHDVLVKQLEKEPGRCGVVGQCVHLLPTLGDQQDSYFSSDNQRLFFGAIRTRSFTSAGMMNTELHRRHRKNRDENEQLALWQLATKLFGIQRDQLDEAQEYLLTHQVEIARDNLHGQCTKGHSCKVNCCGVGVAVIWLLLICFVVTVALERGEATAANGTRNRRRKASYLDIVPMRPIDSTWARQDTQFTATFVWTIQSTAFWLQSVVDASVRPWSES